jgi:hypothetical protein
LASRREKRMERRLALMESVWANPRNALLAALPHEVLSSLRPHLKPVWRLASSRS